MDSLKAFNLRNPTIAIHSFKALAGILDPAMYDPIIDYLECSKASVPGLNKAVAVQQREQWYGWHIMHPGWGDETIHSSRSMPSVSLDLNS